MQVLTGCEMKSNSGQIGQGKAYHVASVNTLTQFVQVHTIHDSEGYDAQSKETKNQG